MAIKFVNSWQTTLQDAIAADATSVSVDIAALALDEIAAGDYYVAKIVDSLESPTKSEIIHITGKTGQTLSISRAQENTNGEAFDSGSEMIGNITAGILAGFMQGAGELPTDLVFEGSQQTLTNKTLTSPKLNEDVVLTKTATALNNTLTEAEVYLKIRGIGMIRALLYSNTPGGL
jgi:hypothetical protein